MKIEAIKKIEFNNYIAESAYACNRYGIDKLKPDRNDTIAMLSFKEKVHDGWKECQNICIKVMCIIDDLKKQNHKILCNHPNDKSIKGEYRSISKELNFQEGVIRSFIESIIWSIFDLKEYNLKRFCIREEFPSFNKLTLLQHLKFVDDINSRPGELAILTDLSKSFHVGDVIIVDNVKHPGGITIL